MLAVAGGDEMHEAPRADLSPVTGKLMAAAREAGAFHAAWSGAGPSAIAFVDETGCEAVEQAMRSILGSNGEVRCLDVASRGWE